MLTFFSCCTGWIGDQEAEDHVYDWEMQETATRNGSSKTSTTRRGVGSSGRAGSSGPSGPPITFDLSIEERVVSD